MSRKKTIEEFRNEYNDKFGKFYDLSKSVYNGAHARMIVVCPIHGEFKITPHELLKGQGCKQCGIERRAEKRKLKLSDFITRSTKTHNGKYRYDLVELEDYKKTVKIICPKHGEFEETPRDHLQGCGCKKCALEYVSELLSDTKEDFVNKAKIIHGDKYDYSLFEYRGSKIDGNIICPKHGLFPQKPCHHLNGCGCPKCGNVSSHFEDEIIETIKLMHEENIKMKKTEEYIKRCKLIHGDKYIYTNVELEKMKDKIQIICPTHGEFAQRADAHLSGQGCPKCANEKVGKNNASCFEKFVSVAKQIHHDKYEYNSGTYINNRTPIAIICPIHGEFMQLPSNHIHKAHPRGCPKCNGGVKLELSDFIQRSNIIHKGKYDYSKVEYVDAHTKVCIICPEHGEFWQEPRAHLEGQGCPKCCRNYSHFEDEIKSCFEDIEVEQRNRKILGGKEIDIYIPSHKIGIEFNGLYWHSEANGKDENYHLNKLNECNKNGVELIQIFEDEWVNKRRICEALLKIAFCLNVSPLIPSTDCELSTNTNIEEIDNFLNENDINPYSEYDVAITAHYNNGIAGILTLNKQSDGEWLINNFTTNVEYNCSGIEKILFEYFVTSYEFNKITFFADRRWVININNNIYTSLGFKVDSSTPPSYTYYKLHSSNLERIEHHKITNNSEYSKIWDCGKIKYVYTKVSIE